MYDYNDGVALRDRITHMANGEQILGICINSRVRDRWKSEDDIQPVRKWEDVEPWLGYTYDSGYGAPSCHAFIAWTESRVIFVSQYDGMTWLDWMPRNPVACKPYMPGGG